MDISIYLDSEDKEQKGKLILPDDVVAKIDNIRQDGETRKDVIIRIIREYSAEEKG